MPVEVAVDSAFFATTTSTLLTLGIILLTAYLFFLLLSRNWNSSSGSNPPEKHRTLEEELAEIHRSPTPPTRTPPLTVRHLRGEIATPRNSPPLRPSPIHSPAPSPTTSPGRPQKRRNSMFDSSHSAGNQHAQVFKKNKPSDGTKGAFTQRSPARKLSLKDAIQLQGQIDKINQELTSLDATIKATDPNDTTTIEQYTAKKEALNKTIAVIEKKLASFEKIDLLRHNTL